MSDWTFNGVARMTEMLSPEALTAFLQVVMIDLVLAGDNAVVMGLAAAGLHESQRKGDSGRHLRRHHTANRFREHHGATA